VPSTELSSRRVAGELVPSPPADFARGRVVAIAAALAALLIAFSGRYGYHRDELYFLECGKHLAWGYPDQPPLVPLLARLMSAISPTSLVVLRLPSAVSSAGLIVVTGLIARELGARSSAQTLAAGSMAVSSVTIATGHLLSTATFDLPVWALVCWLVIRILRGGDQRLWLVVGLVSGLGLFDSDLVAFLLLALALSMAAFGPRTSFKSGWLYAGAAIAIAMWTPYLVWQATHGWPEITISRSIANGGSGSSTPRWALIPEQLVLASPYLAPVWIAGLVRLIRARANSWGRVIGGAYITLLVVFLITGGKAYYLAGMFPVLLAAGAQPVMDWIWRGRTPMRGGLVVAAVLLSLTEIPVVLPVLPVTAIRHTPIVSLNYDAGETIGWQTYVSEIATVYDSLPTSQRRSTVVLASNYGEAGAVDHYGARYGLPAVYSGHNAYWYWGPPPAGTTSAVAVGFDRGSLTAVCASLRLAAHLDNHLGVQNQEQGAPVWICSGPRASWVVMWPMLRHFG
jgi:4-amino-4-deoxy-L-arabinose transferase-like glycosyltransferase